MAREEALSLTHIPVGFPPSPDAPAERQPFRLSFRVADQPGTPFIDTTPSVMTLIRRGASDGFGSPRNRRQTTLTHGALVYKGHSFGGTAKLEIPAVLEILFAEDTITLRN
jgi:hypothetical protein